MPQEIVSATGIAAAVGSKLVLDVCGPTAKYLGGELRQFAEVSVNNLKKVFKFAAEYVQRGNKTEGQVPPRVLRDVLNEGYFCEDELMASYLGGILASAKGPVSRDDRAVAHCALISSLSSYQVRTHYILYSCILKASEIANFPKAGIKDFVEWVRRHNGGTVLIRESDYLRAMDFSENEDSAVIAEHTFIGLQQKGLLEGGTKVCHPNLSYRRQPIEPFRSFHPTEFGIELFLWGLGLGDRGIASYSPENFPNLLPPTIEPLRVELDRTTYS